MVSSRTLRKHTAVDIKDVRPWPDVLQDLVGDDALRDTLTRGFQSYIVSTSSRDRRYKAHTEPPRRANLHYLLYRFYDVPDFAGRFTDKDVGAVTRFKTWASLRASIDAAKARGVNTSTQSDYELGAFLGFVLEHRHVNEDCVRLAQLWMLVGENLLILWPETAHTETAPPHMVRRPAHWAARILAAGCALLPFVQPNARPDSGTSRICARAPVAESRQRTTATNERDLGVGRTSAPRTPFGVPTNLAQPDILPDGNDRPQDTDERHPSGRRPLNNSRVLAAWQQFNDAQTQSVVYHGVQTLRQSGASEQVKLGAATRLKLEIARTGDARLSSLAGQPVCTGVVRGRDLALLCNGEDSDLLLVARLFDSPSVVLRGNIWVVQGDTIPSVEFAMQPVADDSSESPLASPAHTESHLGCGVWYHFGHRSSSDVYRTLCEDRQDSDACAGIARRWSLQEPILPLWTSVHPQPLDELDNYYCVRDPVTGKSVLRMRTCGPPEEDDELNEQADESTTP